MGLVVCIYDWRAPIDWQQEETFCVEAMVRLGAEIDYYAYDLRGHRGTRRGRKSKLGKLTGEISAVGVYDFGGGEINFPQPKACASVSSYPNRKNFYCFSAAHDPIAHRDYLLGLAEWVASEKFDGVGYATRQSELPGFFAAGWGTASSGREDSERDTNWIANRRDQPAPWFRLRDLFSLNILTERHFDFEVHGLKLRDWIDQEQSRGKLYGSKANLWLIDEANLRQLRRELDPTGLLTSRSLPRP